MATVYLDSKKGIKTEGYNQFFIDEDIYPLTTDSSTIDNGTELFSILKRIKNSVLSSISGTFITINNYPADTFTVIRTVRSGNVSKSVLTIDVDGIVTVSAEQATLTYS